MQRVDRLLIKVRRAYGQTNKQLHLAFVSYIPDGDHKGEWEAIAELWDGVEGDEESITEEDRITSYHSTEEEAIDAIKAVEEAHAPIGLYKYIIEEVPIIIDDLAFIAPEAYSEYKKG